MMRALLLLAVFFVSCGAPTPEEKPAANSDAGTSSSPASTPDAGRSALEECRDLCPFARDVEIGPRGDCVCIL